MKRERGKTFAGVRSRGQSDPQATREEIIALMNDRNQNTIGAKKDSSNTLQGGSKQHKMQTSLKLNKNGLNNRAAPNS